MNDVHIFVLKWSGENAWLDGDEERSALALGEADYARATAIRSASRRRQFLLGRQLLWLALKRLYGNDEIKKWRLRQSEQGQPVLFYDATGHDLRTKVSVTHSGSYVGCAIAECACLGVDLEVHKPRDWGRLEDEVFSPDEQADLRSMPEAKRFRRAYELWSLKEAYLKAIGSGITDSMAELNFSSQNELVAASNACFGDIDRWRFATPRISADVSHAVAWYAESQGPSSPRIHRIR